MNGNSTPIDIVIYLAQDWQSFEKDNLGYLFDRVPLIRALARVTEANLRILCVNRPITPIETTIKKPRKIREVIRTRQTLKQLEENLFLYTPFAFVHDRIAMSSWVLREMNRKVLAYQVRRQLARLGFDSPARVSWIHHPFQDTYQELIGESLKVYEVRDAYALGLRLSERLKRSTSIHEERVLRNSDVVLVVSENLYQEKRAKNPNTYLIPPGVDFDLFNKAAHEDLAPPADVADIKPPRLGFTGRINGLVDFKLINYLADTRPEWSIVLIGGMIGVETSEEYQSSLLKPNIHYLGFREYEMMPAYLQHMDVCLLLHDVNQEWLKYANSKKTLEYLATGKPVVSTDTPFVRSLSNAVYIAKDREDFAMLVEEALQGSSQQSIAKRINLARQNSWDHRASQVCQIIREACLLKMSEDSAQPALVHGKQGGHKT
ncbi:MAG: glycosyltransferase [Chloroflexi bacterium]|nr:glycosyltransferase [Chloroflexota bacterium]